MALESAQVHQADGEICLMRKMEAKIGFVHGGRRVMRHGWMAVDAVHFAAPAAAKRWPKNQEPAQVRRPYADSYRLGCKYVPADLERAADAAAVRR